MSGAIRFLWNAVRGHRLTPWRSPYLRWRMETYTGKRAETLQAKDFLAFLFKEKRQFFRFLRWTDEISEFTVEQSKR